MDYKEKYENALERAREELGSGCYNKGTIEYIFPELKKSEDEIVISALKSGIKFLESEYKIEGLGGLYFKKILAWLEKQGEQKNLKDTEETMMYQGEVYTRVYKDELDKFANKYPKTIPHSSKKYAKYSDTDLVIAVKAGAEWQMKQKPAWSEEDEEQLERAIYMMEQLNMTKSWDDVYNWLKSFKLQPHWKPNNEQMDELEKLIAWADELYDENSIRTIESLYNDLKKL